MSWHGLLFLVAVGSAVEIAERKYNVELLGPSISMLDLDGGIPMVTEAGHQYMCILPLDLGGGDSPRLDSKRIVDERTRAHHGALILSKTLGKQCYLRLSGWWIYKFCYGKSLEQYHQDQQKQVHVRYFLGNATGEGEGGMGTLTYGKDVRGPFFRAEMPGGTLCDMTGEPRHTTVHFYCSTNSPHPNNYFHIEEEGTCQYVVRFYTMSVCYMEEFKVQQEQSTRIPCHRLPTRDSLPTAPPEDRPATRSADEPTEVWLQGGD